MLTSNHCSASWVNRSDERRRSTGSPVEDITLNEALSSGPRRSNSSFGHFLSSLSISRATCTSSRVESIFFRGILILRSEKTSRISLLSESLGAFASSLNALRNLDWVRNSVMYFFSRRRHTSCIFPTVESLSGLAPSLSIPFGSSTRGLRK